MDTFELAFAQMLECFDIPQIPFLDCISLRCFGFHMGNAVKEWFRPAISVTQSIDRISEVTGLSISCTPVGSANPFLDKRGVMLGPLINHVAVQELRDYYYQGAENFLFCSIDDENLVEFFDPRGYVGLRLCKDQLRRILFEKTAFCISLKGKECTQTPPVNILEYGLSYHSKVREDECSQMERAAQIYTYSREHTISLQYGVMNFLLQMDKVFILAQDCGWITDRAKEIYIKEKQALYTLSQSETIAELPYIVDRIWRILEHGG